MGPAVELLGPVERVTVPVFDRVSVITAVTVVFEGVSDAVTGPTVLPLEFVDGDGSTRVAVLEIVTGDTTKLVVLEAVTGETVTVLGMTGAPVLRLGVM